MICISKVMYFWNKRTVRGFHQAVDYFQQATTIDPNYALAYAGLANSYTLLTSYSMASANLYMPQARAAALRALELDERLAGSAHGTRFDYPESGLGLANFRKRIPASDRIEPQLRYRPPLVCRASDVAGPLRRGLKRERPSAANWIRFRSSLPPIAARFCTFHGSMTAPSNSFARCFGRIQILAGPES